MILNPIKTKVIIFNPLRKYDQIDQIEEAFQLLEDEINNMGIGPSVETFSRQYVQYIRDTYMSGNF